MRGGRTTITDKSKRHRKFRACGPSPPPALKFHAVPSETAHGDFAMLLHSKKILLNFLCTNLYSLNTDTFAGLIRKTGRQCNTVVRGRLEITPVSAVDDLYSLYSIGPCAINRGICDGIANVQVLDAAGPIFRSAIMGGDSNVSKSSCGPRSSRRRSLS